LLYKIVQCGLVTPEERAERAKDMREVIAS
jgi:hypothetical protein